MRLTGIRLAGFKSFVEPTRLQFSTPMSGIVGPNGCGKSNIVDAIRWVLGESTRNIRGQKMEDIIFDGSSRRDRLDLASVEISLDNHQGILEGKYAEASEIQIRREARREEESVSHYFINGTKVRRRDVADLFQGTGLGRGNYAIIAQNMVNDLIDARPEDMRKYLEEAAGISFYQERRRETENSIQRTEENLRQAKLALQDLNRRLRHSEQQKREAEHKRTLREELVSLQAQWISLQLQDERGSLRVCEEEYRGIDEQCREVEQQKNALQEEYEKQRAQREAADQRKDQAQEAYYKARLAVDEMDGRRKAREENAQRLARECEDLERRIGEQERHLDGIRTRKEELEREVDPLCREFVAMLGESAPPPVADMQENLQALRETAEEYMQGLGERIHAAGEEQKRCEEKLAGVDRKLREQRNALGRARGECEGLRARQQVELAGGSDARAAQEQMLQKLSLRGARLADDIQVEEGWEFAVETVLAEGLGAFCVEASPASVTEERVPGQAALLALHRPATGPADADSGTLAGKAHASISLESLLGWVYTADSLAQAQEMRSRLQPYQSVILRSGLWLGPDWIRWAAGEKATAEGVVLRQREIEEQEERIRQMEKQVEALEQEQQSLQEQQDSRADGLRVRQHALEQHIRSGRHLQERLRDRERELEREQGRSKTLQEEYTKRTEERTRPLDFSDLDAQGERLREDLRQAEQEKEEATSQVEHRKRDQEEADRGRGEMDQAVRDLHTKRHECDKRRQQIKDQCGAHEQQLEELDRDFEEVLQGLPEGAQADEWEQKFRRIEADLAKMPPTNDAAIEEYEELLAEKNDADRQHADIETSLASLREAIQKMDKDTRARMRTAYDEVNEHLGKIFPRIIGKGGRAQLVKTEDNLLTAGVEIQACPPGKRVRTMHMLSGGEQAMVAAAMMLAFFRYKPAPFCILDEVDAPLSDDNLRRFCDILREMSDTVQFLIVTHSKITMEYADHLVGVTMHEPGVSRLVDVDVEQAVQMAEQAEQSGENA